MSEDVQLNMKGLEDLLKAMKGKLPFARVGILGDKDTREKGDAPSNATIGARHEFGTETLPIRSFLRMPLTEQMQKYLDDSGAFTREAFAKVLKDRSLTEWVKKIGIVGEAVIADAFNTGGFGKWAPSDMTRKKNHQTLVETQQLRNSITSEVKE